MRPSENEHYERKGPGPVGHLKEMYDQVLSKAISIAKNYSMVRGMVVPMLIKVREIKENDVDTGLIEVVVNSTM